MPPGQLSPSPSGTVSLRRPLCPPGRSEFARFLIIPDKPQASHLPKSDGEGDHAAQAQVPGAFRGRGPRRREVPMSRTGLVSLLTVLLGWATAAAQTANGPAAPLSLMPIPESRTEAAPQAT